MKILVTGSNGLCGSALRRHCSSSSHDFDFVSSKDCDLRSQSEVEDLFSDFRPDYVVHTAAKVGGILANMRCPEEFLHDNILMNAHVIRGCVTNKVQKLFAFSSVCVFSDNLTMLEEEKINDGPVYEANAAYGYAKRIVDAHIKAAIKQYGFKNWCSIIPGNIFGMNDLFSISNGHIVPAVMHKMFLAKRDGTDLRMIGDGLSLREFIYADDLAKIILQLLDLDVPDKIIVSGRAENSIRDVVETMKDISGFKGEIVWDPASPNGQRSRPSSKERIDKLLPDFQYTPVREGLTEAWNWFVENYPNIRTEYRL